MMKKKWMQIVAVGMSVMMLTACGSAGKSSESKEGSDFPKKQMNMIVQSSPGGLSDQISREIAEEMGADLGEDDGMPVQAGRKRRGGNVFCSGK